MEIFKVNKLFLYVILNYFIYINFLRLNNLNFFNIFYKIIKYKKIIFKFFYPSLLSCIAVCMSSSNLIKKDTSD